MPKINSKSKNNLDYNFLDEDSSFTGNLFFEKPLCIKGRYSGKIEGNSVLKIDTHANVEANLDIQSLILVGKLVGNIIAKEKVTLKQGAQLIGNIRSSIIEIEEGVLFDGHSEMLSEPNANANES